MNVIKHFDFSLRKGKLRFKVIKDEESEESEKSEKIIIESEKIKVN